MEIKMVDLDRKAFDAQRCPIGHSNLLYVMPETIKSGRRQSKSNHEEIILEWTK